MKKPSNTVTMKDVAQAAGVSLGTVSKVMNGIPVGEKYRVKVEAAAKELNYQINQYARGLKTNQTFAVALILPGINHPFFSEIAQHVCQALTRRGYRMLLYLTGSSPEVEQSCVQMVRQNMVDGIIGLTYNRDLQLTDDMPFVSIDRHFSSGVPCVSSDNYGGGRLAAEKLLELGCRKVAYFRNGTTQPGEADKRGVGFEQECRSRDADFEVIWLNDEEYPMEEFRNIIIDRVNRGTFDFDGIFCSTDRLAVFVKRVLTELGIRVPEDVQIIGFDGTRRFGEDAYVCSTIVQPVATMAETCVDLLFSKDLSRTPALVCLPVEYAYGGTTKE